MCSICLESFFAEDVPLNSSQPLLEESIRDTHMIRTPCKHEFHENCLKRWLESKLECPYCRHTLPQLPDTADEEF